MSVELPSQECGAQKKSVTDFLGVARIFFVKAFSCHLPKTRINTRFSRCLPGRPVLSRFCQIRCTVTPACRTRTPECGRFSGHISLARSTQAPEKQHTEDCLHRYFTDGRQSSVCCFSHLHLHSDLNHNLLHIASLFCLASRLMCVLRSHNDAVSRL